MKKIPFFTLDNLLKYGHITLKFVARYFYLVVFIFFSKNRAILVQKIGGRKKIVKIAVPSPTDYC